MRGWIQQVLAVLPVVARSAGVEGVAGGERCGGRRFGRIRGFELRWFLIGLERWGGSVRSRGGGWWRQKDWGGSARDARYKNAAATEVTGDEEDGLSPSISGYGSSRRMA